MVIATAATTQMIASATDDEGLVNKAFNQFQRLDSATGENMTQKTRTKEGKQHGAFAV